MAARWVVMPLISRLLHRVSALQTRTLCAGVQRVSPGSGEEMKKESRDLLKQFPQPKQMLQNAISRALGVSNTRDQLSYITFSSNHDHRVVLRINWPQPIEVEGYGGRKVDAERHAAAQACKIFKDLGLLGSGRKFRKNHKVPSAAASAHSGDPQETGGSGANDVQANIYVALDRPEDLEAVKALKQFPKPKHLLTMVIQVATSSSVPRDYIRYEHEGGYTKTCRLTIGWPQTFTVVARGFKRAEAERKAAALACQKLKDLGLIGPNNQPLSHAVYNMSAVKELREKQRQPQRFWVPEDLLDRMESYLMKNSSELDSEMESEMESSTSYTMDDWSHDGRVSDPITGYPYTPISEEEEEQISRSLAYKWCSSREEPLQELPADQHKAAILSAIENNPVVVIAGDTGCGKTTRIPRFILENAILAERGAQCNIMVTQPRRISAVSVAHRVAQELGPTLCGNVGYQVRLESRLPPRGGALLFCTVGVLLKKLQTNSAMEGISHVVIDEVHERDVSTDFLLILVKQMRELNPDIKVILMSATGDNQRISQYFGGCPIVRVPGFMYPVKEHYLEDVLGMMRMSYRPPQTNDECLPDLELISKVICHIDRHGDEGSILCFLPGWQEIRGVQEMLQEAMKHQGGRHLILPVHSNVPLTNQQSIFQRPPPGVRKIVLATNIAETSVTIDDIVHVVDCGMKKEQRYDLRTKVSCLETTWVSKSNVIQRRGRAGRCQPGFSYHLFSRQQYQEMENFQVPEILRTPLENLVLQAKIHTPEMTAEEFLSQALECPDRAAIRGAVRMLQEIQVLDENEELTLLGQRVAHISTDPSLAKAIVLASIFRCLHPMLTIVACLTRDPFLGGILNRGQINKVKADFSKAMHSDHLAFVRIFQAWKEVLALRNDPSREQFLQDTMLSRAALRYINGLINQFSSNVQDARLVPDSRFCMNMDALPNQLSSQYELVMGVLSAGLYPKLIQVRRGQVIRGKFRPNSILYRTKEGAVLLHKSTVNRDVHRFPSPWLTYFQAVKSTGAVFVRDSSMVHPLAVLLMADCSITYKDNGPQRMVVFLSDSDLLNLESDSRTVKLLLGLRRALQHMVERKLSQRYPRLAGEEEVENSELLSILVDLLNRTANGFSDPAQAEQ